MLNPTDWLHPKAELWQDSNAQVNRLRQLPIQVRRIGEPERRPALGTSLAQKVILADDTIWWAWLPDLAPL